MQELILGITILRHQCALPVRTGQTAHLWSQVAGWVSVTLFCHFCSLEVAPVIVRVKLRENNAVSFPSLYMSPELSAWCPRELSCCFSSSGPHDTCFHFSWVFRLFPCFLRLFSWALPLPSVQSHGCSFGTTFILFSPLLFTFYILPFSQSIIFGFLLPSSLYPPFFLKQSLGMKPRLASNLQCPSLPSKYWKCCHAWHHLRNLFLCIIELLLIE